MFTIAQWYVELLDYNDKMTKLFVSVHFFVNIDIGFVTVLVTRAVFN